MSQEPNFPPGRKFAGDGKTRRSILLTILGLLCLCLIYDYAVARPAVNDAYKRVHELSIATNKSSTSILGREQIQEAIGRAPIDEFKDGTDLVESYGWIAGLPFRTHKLYAVYREQGDDYVFYRHAKFEYEPQKDVLHFTGKTSVNIDFEDDTMVEDSAGGGPSGGGGPGREGGGGGDGPRDRPESEGESEVSAVPESESESTPPEAPQATDAETLDAQQAPQ
ncbi:MAG: hypothetical protein MI861_17240 [Pirellulales bacterium]|nr:hypothetical protein [Pirellulales bacterium]